MTEKSQDLRAFRNAQNHEKNAGMDYISAEGDYFAENSGN